MGRYRKLECLGDYSRALRNKYGLGVGANYKPWLRVQDVRSHGHSGKIFGLKTGREHHVLSENESSLFYLAEFRDDVVDIREQFPLLPLDLSVRISKIIGIEHPKLHRNKELWVVTTDFLLTCSNGDDTWYEAISVKPESGLQDKRAAQKLEIERVWWELLGVSFKIFTNTQDAQITSRNIQWITSTERRNERVVTDHIDAILSSIKPGTYLIPELCHEISRIAKSPQGQELNILKYMLAHKLIKADLSQTISSSGVISIVSVCRTHKALRNAG